MLVHFGTDLLQPEWAEADVCIGTFDGVHSGHRQVIKTAVEKARSSDRVCALVTFDRHPAAVLAPHKVPPAIATLDQNLAAFASVGVPVCVVLHFDLTLANVTASDFLEQILVKKLRASEIVIGHDFAMGKGREGDAAWLKSRIATTIVPAFEIEGRRVSSTEIRRCISEGDVGTAKSLLGRPFAVQGVVVPGQRLGRTIGFPTLNIARSSHLVDLANGVYAGVCRTPNGKFKAAISQGVRPAVGGQGKTLEAYLLDYPGQSLYGAAVELEVHHRLREEQDFPDLDALKRQIESDVEETARRLTPETLA